MDWLKKFKLAIVSRDAKAIQHSIETMPQLKELKELEEALYLTKECYIVMNELKDNTLSQMQQLKKNIDFLESTHSQESNRLDISS